MTILPSLSKFVSSLEFIHTLRFDRLRFATPEIGWISDPDDPELCIWPSSNCYIARQSTVDPFVMVELITNKDGSTDRVATSIGLPCVPVCRSPSFVSEPMPTLCAQIQLLHWESAVCAGFRHSIWCSAVGKGVFLLALSCFHCIVTGTSLCSSISFFSRAKNIKYTDT